MPNVLLNQSERENQEQAAAIVTALDGLPLALDQAGAYIEETRCGFAAYLNLYRTRRKELLLRRGRLPVDHPEPVAATWSLSFQQIEAPGERVPLACHRSTEPCNLRFVSHRSHPHHLAKERHHLCKLRRPQS
jgi:hypothetical protein